MGVSRAARVAAAVGVAALLVPAGAGVAGAGDPPTVDDAVEPITTEMLTPRSRFTDEVSVRVRIRADGARPRVTATSDPSNLVVARITLQPGARFPWHLHPGAVVVTVAEGTLVLTNADDCVDREYAAGTSFVEPDGRVHTARNPTDGETVLVATYLDVPGDGPLSVTSGFEPPTCDVEAGDATTHGAHGAGPAWARPPLPRSRLVLV